MVESEVSQRKFAAIYDHFSSCDIEIQQGSIQPLGAGFLHEAFKVKQLDGNVHVVKIPKFPKVHGLTEDAINVDLVSRYFGRYIAKDTAIQKAKDGRRYIITSSFVDGRPLVLTDILDSNGQLTSIGKQLHEIFAANLKMEQEASYSMDFIGLDGHKSLLQSALGKKPIQLTNIFVTQDEYGNPQLQIIDTDLACMKEQANKVHQTLFYLAYQAQKQVLLRYFYPQMRSGLRMSPKEIESDDYLVKETKRGILNKMVAKFFITENNVIYFTYPLVEFVHNANPDYIIVLDSGARLAGFALHKLYQELYGGLPTQNHAILYRKVSGKMSKDQINERLQPDVEKMLVTNESPTVFVVDDWTKTGRTKTKVKSTITDLSRGKVNVLFGVLRGLGADVTGDKFSLAISTWRNRDDQNGIEYRTDPNKAHPVRSSTARFIRQRISTNVQEFAKRLRYEKKIE